MNIRKQINNTWYNVPIPESVNSIKDFSRYMMVITWGGERQARNMQYFLLRGETYSISGNGVFWVFSK